MYICKGCAFEFGWTQQSTSVPNECKGCQMVDGKPSNYKSKPHTNADRIRAMSDEELRDYLFNKVSVDSICNFCVPKMRTERKCDGHCKNGILEWLKQPADMRGEEDGKE